jgi:hypothetical protein
MEYYTYAYLREDGTPYYIGKGINNRAYKGDCKSVRVPPKNRILFLKTGLTEEEAFKHEIYIINILGRKDIGTGILRNLTDGGEGFSSKQMTILWERRRKKKLELEIKKWRKEYDKGVIWREKNREVFDELIKNVISNRTFMYNNDTI